MNKTLVLGAVITALSLINCGDDDDDNNTTDDVCSASNLTGTCAVGQTCDAGTCADDCSATVTDGYCMDGQTCDAGTCADDCSATVTDGYCMDGQFCDAGTCKDDPINITVEGSISVHPASKAVAQSNGTTLDYGTTGDVVIMLADAIDVITNPTSFTKLGTFPVNPAHCADLACAVSFTEVDISNVSFALLAIVVDSRTGTEMVFVPTQSALAGGAEIAALKATPATLTRPMFAISTESAVTMGTIAGLSNPADIITRGFLFGMILDTDKVSPIDGVTATPLSSSLVVHYPNDAFTGAGSATNAYGFYYAIAELDASSNPTSVLTEITFAHATKIIPKAPGVGTGPNGGFALTWIAAQ